MKRCRCGKEWGEHKTLRDYSKKKTICAWCGCDIWHTDDEYDYYGNCCTNCSGRTDRVIHGHLTKEEAFIELLSKRKKYDKSNI